MHQMHEAENKKRPIHHCGDHCCYCVPFTSLARSRFDLIQEIRAEPCISSPQSCDYPTHSRLGSVILRTSPGFPWLSSGALLYEYIHLYLSLFVPTAFSPDFFSLSIYKSYDSLQSRLFEHHLSALLSPLYTLSPHTSLRLKPLQSTPEKRKAEGYMTLLQACYGLTYSNHILLRAPP